jgi:hypothetical protein
MAMDGLLFQLFLLLGLWELYLDIVFGAMMGCVGVHLGNGLMESRLGRRIGIIINWVRMDCVCCIFHSVCF